MSNSVQYIVVRSDLIDAMGVGKTSAQVAHASLGAILENKKLIETEPLKDWLNGSFTKLTVYVKSKTKLLNLSKKLEEEGIKYKLIWDSCRTMLEPEEKDGTTLTCMGVEPLFRKKVPKYLQKLRLL